MDGVGRVATGVIVTVGKQQVEVKVNDIRQHPAPTSPLTLLQAMPKGDGMDWIIEKAVELGVARIIPLQSERTVVRLAAGEQAEKKQQRWQRRVIEACKQCGQPWFPQLLAPCQLGAALAVVDPAETKLIASLEPGAEWIPVQLPLQAGPVSLAIGPEGDFSAAEYESFRQGGWLPIQLGPLVLRCETAAISAVAVIQNLLSSRAA
jgi:16S rRNA (uracil1498-N3)-methyltransferase